MQIDYALILSAGLGTRMGEIGKKIPKVLWPVYFKTLLELQVRYCEDLGIKKIYVNTHYLHDEILAFAKTTDLQNKIIFLHEDPLLDSGGAIHNLASRPEINYNGNLLLVNGDQFLFFDNQYWKAALLKVTSSRAVLFGITVDKEAAYNETVLEEDKLVEIKKNIGLDHNYITYSGLGILNLNGLVPVPGISRFFEAVANFKKEKVTFVVPDKFEYWDFGTATIYSESVLKLASKEGRESKMGQFLNRHNAFLGNESLFLNQALKAIDLEYKGRFVDHSIVGRDLIQKY